MYTYKKSNIYNEVIFNIKKEREKSLTDPTIINILYVIGISDDLLSSQQIINKMKELKLLKGDGKKIHDKLKKLVPFTDRFDDKTFLFDWDEFPKNDNSYDDISILNRLTNLIRKKDPKKWKNNKWSSYGRIGDISYERIGDNKYEIDENIKIDESKKEKEKILTISYSKQEIIIDLNRMVLEYCIDSKKQFDVHLHTLRTSNNTLGVYLFTPNIYKTYYLRPVLNETFQKKYKINSKEFNEIKDLPNKIICLQKAVYLDENKTKMVLDPEIHDDLTNSRYWKYGLNYIGILFYLYGELKHNRNNQNRNRILEVISNKKIQEIAIYLKYWHDFSKVGFPVLEILRKIVSDFQPYILNDINYISNRYLILQINNICLNEIDRYFEFKVLSPFTFLSKKNSDNYMKLDISNKVKDYKRTILGINETLLKKELEDLESYKNNLV